MIKFYRPNDFSNVLEYFVDKYLLKFLAKFKGHKLKLKAQHLPEDEEKKDFPTTPSFGA